MLFFKTKNERIKEFILKSFQCSYSIIQLLISFIEEENIDDINYLMKNQKYLKVFFKIEFLLLNCIDRMIFNQISPNNRNTYITNLATLKIESDLFAFYPNYSDDEIKPLFEEYKNKYIQFITDYAQYQKLFPVGNEGTKNTLLWEFSKKVVFELSPEKPNPAYIMMIIKIINDFFKNFDILNFVKKTL